MIGGVIQRAIGLFLGTQKNQNISGKNWLNKSWKW